MTSDDPIYPEEYYEHLARILGQEQADWARLPRADRERELSWLHKHFDTPDDLAEWPPELDGGLHNERLVEGRSLIRRESVASFPSNPSTGVPGKVS
jgi:hypothetical protein